MVLHRNQAAFVRTQSAFIFSWFSDAAPSSVGLAPEPKPLRTFSGSLIVTWSTVPYSNFLVQTWF